MTIERAAATFAVIVVVAATAAARADEAPPRRPPLPEPIFTESVTDIDGYEPGEVEFDVDGSESIARRNGARLAQTAFEAEWKVWSRLGVRLEPSFASSREELATSAEDKFGFRGAAGWNLVHDFAHDFHLQIEASGRFIDDTPDAFRTQPGEAPLPFSTDLKAAIAGSRSLSSSPADASPALSP